MMTLKARTALAGAALAIAVAAHAYEPAPISQHARGPGPGFERFGPASLPKCRAFARVLHDTRMLQKAHHGRMPAAARRRLERELAHAKAMPPASTTPAKCGVPL